MARTRLTEILRALCPRLEKYVSKRASIVLTFYYLLFRPSMKWLHGASIPILLVRHDQYTPGKSAHTDHIDISNRWLQILDAKLYVLFKYLTSIIITFSTSGPFQMSREIVFACLVGAFPFIPISSQVITIDIGA